MTRPIFNIPGLWATVNDRGVVTVSGTAQLTPIQAHVMAEEIQDAVSYYVLEKHNESRGQVSQTA